MPPPGASTQRLRMYVLEDELSFCEPKSQRLGTSQTSNMCVDTKGASLDTNVHIQGSRDSLPSNDVAQRLADVEARMKATLTQLEDLDRRSAVKLDPFVEYPMRDDKGGFADCDWNDRLDGVEIAMEELTDLYAQKHAAFETKFEESCTQLANVSESKLLESEQAIASKLEELEASIATSMHERQTAELDAIIDKKLDEGVKDLLLGALKAAVVPLAANFEVRMADFEQKMNMRLPT